MSNDINLQQLEERWYKSLETGTPDYAVYDMPDYLGDLWACWKKYSSQYLKRIESCKSLDGKSILSDMDPHTIIDLGCGLALTTAKLSLMFPFKKVIGTNIPGTFQFNMAKDQCSHQRDIQIQKDLEPADLVVAFEYFEHFERPVEHLIDVLRVCQPRYLLIANSFTSRAIGHFNFYYHGDIQYSGKQMGREFNKYLKGRGYEKVKTKCWNDRPAYWRRK